MKAGRGPTTPLPVQRNVLAPWRVFGSAPSNAGPTYPKWVTLYDQDTATLGPTEAEIARARRTLTPPLHAGVPGVAVKRAMGR